jgi:hypothetical protein
MLRTQLERACTYTGLKLEISQWTPRDSINARYVKGKKAYALIIFYLQKFDNLSHFHLS